MAYFTQSRPVAEGVFGQATGFSFTDLVARIVAWNDARQTRKVLYNLSDRELDDIGLARSDIEDIAAGRR